MTLKTIVIVTLKYGLEITEVVPFESLHMVSYLPSVVTMAVSLVTVTCVDDFCAILLVPNSQTYLNHGYR